MDLPTIIPQEFEFLRLLKTEEEFVDVLFSRSREQIVLFFEVASEDEGWCERHEALIRRLFQWMADSFNIYRLSQDQAMRVVEKIHLHRRVLAPLLPMDLRMDVRGRSVEGNSLLYGAVSSYLRELIRNRYRPGKILSIALGGVTQRIFALIEEYVQTGRCEALHVESKTALKEDLVQAVEWGIEGFGRLCVEAFKRYMDLTMAIELLPMVQEYQLSDLRMLCCATWNNELSGAKLESASEDELALILTEYRDREFSSIEKVIPIITRLGFRGEAAQEPHFLPLLERCKVLEILDLNDTTGCDERFFDVRLPIHELRLASCQWVSNVELVRLFYHYAPLHKLDLSGNVQLSSRLWKVLAERSWLESLRLAHCHQLTDEDAESLLITLGTGLHELDFSRCPLLTDRVVRALARVVPNLQFLDLSHLPYITDRGMHDLSRFAQLQTLHVVGCMGITDEGVLAVALTAPRLTLLDVRKCKLSDGIKTEIRNRKPDLQLLV